MGTLSRHPLRLSAHATGRRQRPAGRSLAHLSANSRGSRRKAWQSSLSEGCRKRGRGWGGCRRAARHSLRSSPCWPQHCAAPGCAGKGESGPQDFSDSAVDCGRGDRRLWPRHAIAHYPFLRSVGCFWSGSPQHRSRRGRPRRRSRSRPGRRFPGRGGRFPGRCRWNISGWWK